MADKIIMPKTGMAMEEGIIIEWFKKEGDFVEKGEAIAEIETDKATMELESDYEGTLLKILYPNSTTIPVVETIAWIGKPGEAVPDTPVSTSTEGVKKEVKPEKTTSEPEIQNFSTKKEMEVQTEGGRVKATPAARKAAEKQNISLEEITPSGKFGEIREKDVLSASGSRLTPLAASIAADESIDIKGISGSGYQGKIFKDDLSSISTQNQSSSTDDFDDKLIPLTNIQKITGKRMLQSHLEVPVVTINTKADITELLDIRKKLNESDDISITINDFILLAAAKALRKNPRMNSILQGNSILYRGHINLGMAVTTPRGLLVPVINDADLYSLTGISLKARELANKSKDGKLLPDEMEGGSFTVSNVGMFGITAFTPIINQPESGILGICAIEDELKMINDKIVNRKIMGLSLTFDHRAVDGAESAFFVKTVRDLLEKPLTILI